MTFECSRVPAPLVFQHTKYFGFRGPTQLLNPNIFEPGSANSRGNDVFTSVYFCMHRSGRCVFYWIWWI